MAIWSLLQRSINNFCSRFPTSAVSSPKNLKNIFILPNASGCPKTTPYAVLLLWSFIFIRIGALQIFIKLFLFSEVRTRSRPLVPRSSLDGLSSATFASSAVAFLPSWPNWISQVETSHIQSSKGRRCVQWKAVQAMKRGVTDSLFRSEEYFARFSVIVCLVKLKNRLKSIK